MSQINLLPWREEAREQLRKEYLGLLGLVAVGAAILLFIWISFAIGQLDNQKQRNSYLEANIAEMNKKVSEISDLKRKKEEMILRMKVIQDLQGTRSEIVKIFDELVRAMQMMAPPSTAGTMILAWVTAWRLIWASQTPLAPLAWAT